MYRAIAEAWIAKDPDPETRAELEALLDNEAALASRFSERLNFGTAGLRGELGAGPNRMNRVVVADAALGLSNFLGGKGVLVIGYDGRVNSDVFARDTAEIAAATGLEVYLFDRMVPTPVLAFAVKHLNAAAGVMVTASHNPPRDNGYKVYLGGANGGGQIISPTDSLIQAEILAVAKSTDPWPRSESYSKIGNELIEEYIKRVVSVVGRKGERQPRIVYTAMHGVGWKVAQDLFRRLGFNDVHSVEEQQEPDGTFPTVSFPNPEEPGALDLAIAKAEEIDADIILANDPDADRLAVVIRQNGELRRLTGDQVGLLLGDWVAANHEEGSLACSLVSSDQLRLVAKRKNMHFEQTKTGFKWISKVPGLIFGFEEALGYCIDPAVVPDKDGVSAAMAVASIESMQPLAEVFERLGVDYGHVATSQVSIRFESVSLAHEAYEKLTGLGSVENEMIHYSPLPNSKALFRVSGTEPKLKCYIQATGASEFEANENLEALRAKVTELTKS